MYVYCKLCGYNSGDEDSSEELAIKVVEDGGVMIYTETGLYLECPNFHNGKEVVHA